MLITFLEQRNQFEVFSIFHSTKKLPYEMHFMGPEWDPVRIFIDTCLFSLQFECGKRVLLFFLTSNFKIACNFEIHVRFSDYLFWNACNVKLCCSHKKIEGVLEQIACVQDFDILNSDSFLSIYNFRIELSLVSRFESKVGIQQHMRKTNESTPEANPVRARMV